MTARTHATIHAKAPRSPRVQVQVSTDGHGTPYVWVREDGRAPVLLVGRVALAELHAGLSAALRSLGDSEDAPRMVG